MEGGAGRQRSSEKQSKARGCISKVFSSSKAAGVAAAPAAAAPAAAAAVDLPAGDQEDLLPIHGLELPAGLLGPGRGHIKLPDGTAAAAVQRAGECKGLGILCCVLGLCSCTGWTRPHCAGRSAYGSAALPVQSWTMHAALTLALTAACSIHADSIS
jgi:hypothetical protein